MPTLETDEGLPITESLLILLWLEKKKPEPSLLDGPLDRIISQAGRAMGVIDAMVHISVRAAELDASLVAAGGGARRTVPLRHDLSPRQANLLIAGGVFNWPRGRLEPGRAGAEPDAPALLPG